MTIQDTEDFDRRLGDSLEVLVRCQNSQDINSCWKCKEDMISCSTRKDYVKAVYESMNKGGKGGFEF